MTTRAVFLGGGVYALAYVVATNVLPHPASVAVQGLAACAFLLPPTVFAAATALRTARRATRAEAAFWGLLGLAAIAQIVDEILYISYRGLFPDVQALFVAGHLAYYAYLILVVVGLLVRPERPLPAAGVAAAALEWGMALVGVCFLVLYFAAVPSGEAGYPWAVVYTLQEAAPALLALGLALRDRGPFRRTYALLAAGFGSAALVGAVASWIRAHAAYEFFNPFDLQWLLSFVFLAAAARLERAPVPVAAPVERENRRASFAVLAVSIPPFIDIGARLLGLQPGLAPARSDLALGSAALLAVLVAARVRLGAPRPAAAPAVGRAGHMEFFHLASGAAHELNNPLMAVAGWAELASRRAAGNHTIDALLAAVRRAAAIVARLQKLARTGRAPEESA